MAHSNCKNIISVFFWLEGAGQQKLRYPSQKVVNTNVGDVKCGGRVCMLRGYLCKATTAGGLVFQWGTQI